MGGGESEPAGGRYDHRLLVGRFRQLAERLDVFLGDEVVDGVDVAAGDGLRDGGGRGRFRFGRTLARLGVAEGGFLAALGLENGRLFGAVGAGDGRLPVTLGLDDHRALFTFGLHLTGHGVSDVGRRGQVLDLDAHALDAPRMGRLVDGRQQARVDQVALRQHLVEVHRAHHRPQVGHGQLGDSVVQVVDPIGRLGRIDHLDEDDAVDLDGDVVLGDHVLARHFQNLLHHVHAASDAFVERDEDGQAGLQRPHVLAETLDGEFMALRHDLDGAGQDDHGQRHDDDNGDGGRNKDHFSLPLGSRM